MRQLFSFLLLIFIKLPLAAALGHTQSTANQVVYTNQVAYQQPVAASGNLWSHIRQGFQLNADHLNNPLIARERRWYLSRHNYLKVVSKQARPYIYYVVSQLNKRHLPTELALVPVIESFYDPFAHSNKRAVGLWQFISQSARVYGIKINHWYDGRRDVVSSTQAALNLFTKLNQYYKGDWLLTLAAYNYGPANIDRAIKHNKRLDKPTDFWSLPLPSQTKSYIPKLLALVQLVMDPGKYGIQLPPIVNRPYFTETTVKGPVNLHQLAKQTDTSLAEMHALNPGFRHWLVPKGHYVILLPEARQQAFKHALDRQIKVASQQPNWHHYLIQTGDDLYHIAKRFHSSIALIKYINHLTTDHIHSGDALLVPDVKQLPQTTKLLAKQATRHQAGYQHARQTYLVKAGDSLWAISRHFKVSVAKLAGWNKLSLSSELHPGQPLVIWPNHYQTNPHYYQVQSGDTLWQIAQDHHLSLFRLVEWNQINPSQPLKVGQRIKVWQQD
jgi:membrane-bound lytic murein transglycosylase D